MNYTITGTLKNNLTKKDVIKRMSANGHKCWSHINIPKNENVDFLIADYPSDSRKYREAYNLGIPIFTVEEIYAALG